MSHINDEQLSANVSGCRSEATDLSHHRQREAFLFDLFPAAAEFSDWGGGFDFDSLITESGFPFLDAVGEFLYFIEQAIEDLVLLDGRDLLALDVDDAFVSAGKNRHVGALGFARAVH